mmetsp:Transcript_20753/g.73856  ORF Transcript_20753/g.73856 Transcript_20753/m.73856 type:complete len:400 (+) Transcript_20753:133-1332(+)
MSTPGVWTPDNTKIQGWLVKDKRQRKVGNYRDFLLTDKTRRWFRVTYVDVLLKPGPALSLSERRHDALGLCYYKNNRNLEAPRAWLSIAGTTKVTGVTPTCFVIEHPKRSYILHTATGAELKLWVDRLTDLVALAQRDYKRINGKPGPGGRGPERPLSPAGDDRDDRLTSQRRGGDAPSRGGDASSEDDRDLAVPTYAGAQRPLSPPETEHKSEGLAPDGGNDFEGLDNELDDIMHTGSHPGAPAGGAAGPGVMVTKGKIRVQRLSLPPSPVPPDSVAGAGDAKATPDDGQDFKAIGNGFDDESKVEYFSPTKLRGAVVQHTHSFAAAAKAAAKDEAPAKAETAPEAPARAEAKDAPPPTTFRPAADGWGSDDDHIAKALAAPSAAPSPEKVKRKARKL